MSTPHIPVIDLQDFCCREASRKKRFVKILGETFEEIGFACITGHFLSNQVQDELYETVARFFALDEEVKNQYFDGGLAGQRGYTPFGREQAKGHKTPDLKEFWQFGQPRPPQNFNPAEYPKNLDVAEIPSFNPVSMKAYRLLEATGMEVLRAIALYLKLGENFFDQHVKGGNSILRAIHYPPLNGEPGDALRAAEHEDINLITLLMGASAEGLEVKARNGEWLAVNAQPGQLVVNVGDMLQRLTNGKLVSTTHRVANPPKEKWGTSRYSIPFFLHPVSNMYLNCLPQCVDEENPKKFEDITAGQYLDERLREIGLKK